MGVDGDRGASLGTGQRSASLLMCKGIGVDTKDRDEALRYLGYLHDALGLAPWRIVLLEEPTKADEEEEHPATAEIQVHSTRWTAQVRLSPFWFTFPATEKREALVHELLHLFSHRYHRVSRQWLVHRSTRDVGLALAQLDEEEESMVDRHAVVLAPRLAPFPGPLTHAGPNVTAQYEEA